MKSMVRNVIFTLLLSIMIGYALLCLASGIPYANMRKQVEESAEYLSTQPTIQYSTISGRIIDNFADSMMLLMSAYEGNESVYKEAADSYYINIKNEDPRQTLVDIANRQKGNKSTYSRYWHGYKLFLAPLLTVFNIKEIRWIQAIIQAVLLTVLLMLVQRLYPRMLLPLGFMLLFMTPNVICYCLELSSAFVIMILSCIVLIWDPNHKLRGFNAAYLFLIAGILTAYFDFLTAPTITLTVPLAMLCMMREGEKNRLKIILLSIALWFIGYAGMWAGKWVIAYISRGKAFFDELVHQIQFRTSVSDLYRGNITRSGVLTNNFKTLFDIPYVMVMTCCYAGIMIGIMVRNYRRISFRRLQTALLLYIPMFVGIGWILIMTNHSSMHHFFTHRTLAPTVFCMLCALDVIPASPARHSLSTDQEVKPHAAHDTDAMPE